MTGGAGGGQAGGGQAGGHSGGAVGGSGAVGGDGGGQPGPPPPIDPSILPLTDAIAHLTLAVDPSSGKAKGMVLRPEYYVQHVKGGSPLKQIDHSKLSYKDLVYGWFCVIQHLRSVGGDLTGYIEHCKFTAEQAMSGAFMDSAYVNFDRHVVGKVVDGLQQVFPAGDLLGVASNFNAANLVSSKPPVASTTGRRGGKSRFYNKNKPSGEGKDRSSPDYMPEGFPDDICYSYNYKSCSGKCSKRHVCRICKKDHKASSCPSKSD